MKQSGKTIIVVLVGAALLVGAIYYITVSSQKSNQYINEQSNTQEPQFKEYQSKNLKFKIKVPSSFQVEEKFTLVIFKSGAGNVILSRNGTNFEDIGSYLEDLAEKNNFILDDKNETQINKYRGLKGKVKRNSGEIDYSYFIYVDGWVYTLSTTAEFLNGDLDQIAQSFEYTP